MNVIDNYDDIIYQNALTFLTQFFERDYNYENSQRFLKLEPSHRKLSELTGMPIRNFYDHNIRNPEIAKHFWIRLRSCQKDVLQIFQFLNLNLIKSYHTLRLIDFSSRNIDDDSDSDSDADSDSDSDSDSDADSDDNKNKKHRMRFRNVIDYLEDIGNTFEVLNLSNNWLYHDNIRDLADLIKRYSLFNELWLENTSLDQYDVEDLIPLIKENKLRYVKCNESSILEALKERIVKYETPYLIKDGHLLRKTDNYYAVLNSSSISNPEDLSLILDSLSNKSPITLSWIPPNSYYRILNDQVEVFHPNQWHRTPDVVN